MPLLAPVTSATRLSGLRVDQGSKPQQRLPPEARCLRRCTDAQVGAGSRAAAVSEPAVVPTGDRPDASLPAAPHPDRLRRLADASDRRGLRTHRRLCCTCRRKRPSGRRGALPDAEQPVADAGEPLADAAARPDAAGSASDARSVAATPAVEPGASSVLAFKRSSSSSASW